MRVHTYVISMDAGSAPNYDPPFVTLAVCKPRIRKRAQPGEMVVAFAGQRLNRYEPHTVVWAGVVDEVLTFSQYWDDKRFQVKKPKSPNGSENPLSDNFYKPANDDLAWVENDVHSHEEKRRDTGGRFVLIFSPSWRFGAHGPRMPEEFGLRMTTGRRSDPYTDISDGQWKRLKAWLGGTLPSGLVVPPHARQCVSMDRPDGEPDRPKKRKTC